MKSHDESLFATAAAHSSRESGVTVTYEACSRYNSLIMAGRFRLPNGLRILLLPDGRAPVFAYQTWFDVGSRDEDPKCTGMAHLCEHLMFKGTAKHPTGELDREMENRGAQT
ncbi:MAG: insulinase family protein [Myxococcota bacterium]